MANMTGRKMGQITMICLMAIISTSSSAFGDSSRAIVDRLKPLINEEDSNQSPIKKAYTYVSEYKRLPVFNFGIGKRWPDVNGIKGAQPYSFGFGKRGNSANFYPLRMGMDYMPYANYDNYMNNDMSNDARDEKKRGGRVRQYDFGVGKRNSVKSQFDTNNIMSDNRDDNNEEMKKHVNDDLEQRFMYGLSNRFANQQDNVQEDD